MSEYHLQTANNSNANLDLGKLYFFPVAESELKAQGIEKQWFLTHQKRDRLLSGYINKDGQWSLCNPQDLTPTHDYYEVDKLWELLQDDLFVAGLNSQTAGRNWNRSDESNDEDAPGSDSSLKLDQFRNKNISLNVPQTAISSFSLEDNAEEEQEAVVEEEDVERGNQEGEIEPPPAKVQLEREEQRRLLEQDLRTILWEGYKADLLNVEAQETDQPWMMVLDADLIKLTSAADKHTVFAIDKQGEIKKHLSLADANLLIDDSVLHEEGNRESRVENRKEENDSLSLFELNKQKPQKLKGLEIE